MDVDRRRESADGAKDEVDREACARRLSVRCPDADEVTT